MPYANTYTIASQAVYGPCTYSHTPNVKWSIRASSRFTRINVFNTDEITNIEEVCERLLEAHVQWFALGEALGLDYNTLITINVRHRGESWACLCDMIAERLQSDRPLTWEILCDCLKKITVRRNDVAAEIQQELGKKLAQFTHLP